MSERGAVPCLIVAVLLSGCAVRPLPENVAKVNSYEIVRRVRCEMRDGIRAFVIHNTKAADPVLAEQLRDDGFYRTFDQRLLPPNVRAGVDTYNPTLIAYNFTFDVTEVNNIGASADFADSLSPLYKLNIGAGTERKRNNTQTFRITDTFERLTRMVGNDYCTGRARKSNLAYPITGHLDLVHIVKTFLDLNQSGNLAGPEGKNDLTLTESMQFTTKILANFDPKLEIDPAEHFDLVAVGVTANASREDIHKLVVVLTLPPKGLDGLSIAEKRIEQELEAAADRDDARTLGSKLDQALD